MTLALPPLPTPATWKVRAIQGLMLGDADGDADGIAVGEAVAVVALGDALGDFCAVGAPQPAHTRRRTTATCLAIRTPVDDALPGARNPHGTTVSGRRGGFDGPGSPSVASALPEMPSVGNCYGATSRLPQPARHARCRGVSRAYLKRRFARFVERHQGAVALRLSRAQQNGKLNPGHFTTLAQRHRVRSKQQHRRADSVAACVWLVR